jgi:hypothetical protein
MRWCEIAVVVLVGCGPRIDTERGQEFAEGTGGSAGEPTDTGTVPDDDDGSSGFENDACPVVDPGVAFTMTVEFPGNELPSEGGALERNARCTVAGVEAGPGTAELLLECDVEEGGSGVAYRIAFENDDDPFASWVDPTETIDLQYEKWSGFETGSGQSLALSQDGIVHLLVHTEGAGGGFVGVCADSQGAALTAAEEWLWKFDALLNERPCIEGSMFRLVVPTRDGDDVAYPGTRGVLEDVSFVYPEATCSYVDGGSEDWRFSLLLWR